MQGANFHLYFSSISRFRYPPYTDNDSINTQVTMVLSRVILQGLICKLWDLIKTKGASKHTFIPYRRRRSSDNSGNSCGWFLLCYQWMHFFVGFEDQLDLRLVGDSTNGWNRYLCRHTREVLSCEMIQQACIMTLNSAHRQNKQPTRRRLCRCRRSRFKALTLNTPTAWPQKLKYLCSLVSENPACLKYVKVWVIQTCIW